jgi:hypothetical protein
LDASQLAKDTQFIRRGWEVTYVFGREPTAATIQKLEDLGIRYEVFYAEPVLAGARR